MRVSAGRCRSEPPRRYAVFPEQATAEPDPAALVGSNARDLRSVASSSSARRPPRRRGAAQRRHGFLGAVPARAARVRPERRLVGRLPVRARRAESRAGVRRERRGGLRGPTPLSRRHHGELPRGADPLDRGGRGARPPHAIADDRAAVPRCGADRARPRRARHGRGRSVRHAAPAAPPPKRPAPPALEGARALAAAAARCIRLAEDRAGSPPGAPPRAAPIARARASRPAQRARLGGCLWRPRVDRGALRRDAGGSGAHPQRAAGRTTPSARCWIGSR